MYRLLSCTPFRKRITVFTLSNDIFRFNPDIVIGTGGYVCGPVVYAAAK
ncbi:hypothetical protein N3930_15630, partial [Bacillus thuringiensis]|nr:hypothetical protein [Bacillus thuringiensis]